MAATYTKLRDGSWGVRVTGTANAGDKVTVTKKSGESKTEEIARVLWTGNGVSLCAIKQGAPVMSASRPQRGTLRGRRTGCSCGSIEGEYHPWYCETCKFDELDQ